MTKCAGIEADILLAMSPEEYMNQRQQDFFRQLLQQQRQALLHHIDELKSNLQPGDSLADDGDKAIREEELRLLFRQIDRESRMLPKFDAALQRLRNGDYGYCIETGEPIGLRRLLLRPTADLSIDAKATREIKEAQYRHQAGARN